METLNIFQIAGLYKSIYLNSLLLITMLYAITYKQQTAKNVLEGNGNFTLAALLSIIVIVFFGTRPVSYAFSDTALYGHLFTNIDTLADTDTTNLHENEDGFKWLMLMCRPFMEASGFMLVVATGYVGFMLLACRKLMPNNTLAAVIFNLGSFSFYSYGTNGIRNGLACSMILLGLAFMTKNRREQIIGIAICTVATYIHRSAALPFLMALSSLYIIHKFKTAYTFWIVSIFLSLILGNTVANLFASLGFDDRMSGYLNNTEALSSEFSSSGFRWDFLIYSSMPIVLGYYVIVKKGIRNLTYEFLLNTYILSNAFWVIVIRAAFSNRFAYLSWFLYPIVVAYPLLKLPIWENNQGSYLKKIMLANFGFTYIMWLLGK